MDTLFLAVTGFSLLLVLVMAIVVARMWYEERRRSEARVAALLAMAGQRPDEDDVREAVVHRSARRATALDDIPLRDETTRRTHGVRGAAPSIEVAHESETTQVPMFAQPERSTAWGRRVAIIVPLAIIIIGAGIAFYPSSPDIAAPAVTATPAPDRAAVAVPLELLSLRHTQQADSLTVTGLVQNPRTGTAMKKVFVTAFVFAADGSFLASGRAPLDFTTLGPGDESPFVVTVPVKGEVARYRVGFRGEDGRVIAHVDRRAASAIARATEERP